MTEVDDLEINVRTRALLRNLGVQTIDQFMALDRPTVLSQMYAGAKTWRDIDEAQEGIRHRNIASRTNDEKLVERVARAICLAELPTEDKWHLCVPAAEAAIAAYSAHFTEVAK